MNSIYYSVVILLLLTGGVLLLMRENNKKPSVDETETLARKLSLCPKRRAKTISQC
jgi:hypothetical protein